MKVWLAREDKRVSRKRVQRLMRITALRARRYDSNWYIPGAIHGGDYNPMDGGASRWVTDSHVVIPRAPLSETLDTQRP